MFENIFWGRDMRYKFRYYNKGFKLLSMILAPLQNFFFVIVIIVPIILTVISLVFGLIGLEKQLDDYTAQIIYKIIITFSFLCAISYYIFPKGVFLYEKRLIIARHTVSLRN